MMATVSADTNRAKIVDVAMRVIAGDALLQPNDIGRPQIVAQRLFHLLLRLTRIPRLHIRQQAFPRRK